MVANAIDRDVSGGAPTPSLKELVAETPDSRDRYVDLLRALSIAVVVFGHWLMAAIYMRDGRIFGVNALEEMTWLWPLTWILQVMPLFFFVGGFSHLVTWDSHRRLNEGYAAFVRGRTVRLMKPTALFIAIWLSLAAMLQLFPGVFGGALDEAGQLLALPLWFLGVYLLIVAVAPLMLRVHRSFGLRVVPALTACAALVDVLRVGAGVPVVGYLNFAFVWLLAHQLGFFYADGSLLRWSRKAFLAAGGLALTGLVALTNLGPYSRFMVGASDGRVSNNRPPSVCLILLTIWLVALAMLARGPLSCRLRRPRPWAAVIAVNSVIMTMFLWHLTALVLAVVVLYPLGYPQPDAGTAAWWAFRPVWLATLVGFLVGLVALFGRFERPSLTKQVPRSRPSGAGRAARAVTPARVEATVAAGVGCLVLGVSGFAASGFTDAFVDPAQPLTLLRAHPVANTLYLGVGALLLRASARGPG
ncbi:MAG: acyltransferase family protein [Actinomycetota bacterium]